MAKASKLIKSVITDAAIINKVYLIRGHKVMLDKDLAEMYAIDTKVLKQAVKRNAERFPKDFMFILTQKEFQHLRSQIVTSSWGGSRYMPFAFTEQGVAMLSGVINSPKAIEMNIAIMRAFVEMRKLAQGNNKLAEQLKIIFDRLGEHDVQLSSIYDAIENLLDNKAERKSWDERERIGFVLKKT